MPVHEAPKQFMKDPIKAPWKVVDGHTGSLDVLDSEGNLVCSVYGDTLGDEVDRVELIASAPKLRDERDELASIAWTIHKYASGPIPWGGCKCDRGHDGRAPLVGDVCGRCTALERLKVIAPKQTP